MNKIIIAFIILSLSSILLQAENTKTTNIKKDPVDEKTIEFWHKTLKYGTSEQKASIINYIRTQRIIKGEPLLLEYIKTEKNIEIKKQFINTLVFFSNQQVLPYILDLLKPDNSNEIKTYASAKLGDLRYKDAYKYIMDHLDSEDPLLKEAVLRTLGDTEAEPAVDILLKKITEEQDEKIKTQIILTLANIKSLKSYQMLQSVFTNTDEKELNRGFAATGLGYIKQKSSYELLTRYYPSVPPNIKMRILDSLGNLGFPDAADQLIEALKDDNENIRYYSIIALGKLNIKQAVEILEYKKDFDPMEKVRLKAKEVLKILKGEEADPKK